MLLSPKHRTYIEVTCLFICALRVNRPIAYRIIVVFVVNANILTLPFAFRCSLHCVHALSLEMYALLIIH